MTTRTLPADDAHWLWTFADASTLLREMQPFAVPRYWVWEDVQRLAGNG
ncbi:MAG: hypothetical protein Q7J29_03285 [Stagnimonas sp.]|nr:hypothetical protein [Stagnimonas sp.]